LIPIYYKKTKDSNIIFNISFQINILLLLSAWNRCESSSLNYLLLLILIQIRVDYLTSLISGGPIKIAITNCSFRENNRYTIPSNNIHSYFIWGKSIRMFFLLFSGDFFLCVSSKKAKKSSKYSISKHKKEGSHGRGKDWQIGSTKPAFKLEFI
jgi:hypothetical protein